MKNVLVGTYSVPGHGTDTVETPLVGHPQAEKQALDKAILKKYPEVKGIVRTGTFMERRGGDDQGAVELTPGLTLGQLFREGAERRKVGRTFLSGSPYDIILSNHRAQGVVTFTLKALLKNDSDIRLPDRLSPQLEADKLGSMLKGILGEGARDTKLDIKEAVLKTAV